MKTMRTAMVVIGIMAMLVGVCGLAKAGEPPAETAQGALSPSDADFKARFEKVKERYASRKGERNEPKVDPKEQAEFLAAWDKGCPVTRWMLFMKLREIEENDQPKRYRHEPVMKAADRMDAVFALCSDEGKAQVMEDAVATASPKRVGDKVDFWGRIFGWFSGHQTAWVEAVAMATGYPKGIEQRERPFVWTTRAELPELKKRLEKDPWKEWYRLVVKISDAAMVGKELCEDEELRLRFPEGRPGKLMGHNLPNALECIALRYYIEGKQDYGLKVKELLLKANSWKNVWSKSDVGFFAYRMGPKPPGLPKWMAGSWCFHGAEVMAYDLTADLFTPEERLDVERTFAYRASGYLSQTGELVNYQSMRYDIGAAGVMCLAVNWKAGVDRLLLALKGYSYAGEGEANHYWGYNMHTMHNLWGEWGCAYKHMYGKSPFEDRPDFTRHIEHFASISSPFGTTPAFGDVGIMSGLACYSFWEMNLLPDPARGMLMWTWQRTGDPRIVFVGASDRRRLAGEKMPCFPQGWSYMFDQYDPTKRETRHPVGEAKLVRAILSFREFPEPIAPPVTYIAPKDGVVVLRSGLDPDDLYLVTHTKRIGDLGIHGRRDTLSMEVFAYGSPIIVHPDYGPLEWLTGALVVKDPPPPCKTWGGFNGNPTSYRSGIWANSVAAIGMDGGLSPSGGGAGYWLRHDKADGLPVEAVTANSGDGYFGKSDPKGHFRRVIMLVKPDAAMPKTSPYKPGKPSDPKGYFVLVDDLITTKADAESRWLIQPRGSKVEGDDDTKIWTSCDFLNIPPKTVKLVVHWVRLPESKVEMKMGVWSLGLDKEGEERPFPDIQWKGPGRMITVLYPLADGMAVPKIDDLPGRKGVKVGEDTIEADAEKVTFKRGGKVFVVELKAAKQ